MRRRPLLPLAALALLTAAVGLPATSAGASEQPTAWVVRTSADPAQVAAVADVDAGHVYRSAVRGFSAELTASEAAELRAEPGVVAVVPDAPVHALGTQVPAPTWGLDRIDQRALPLSGGYGFDDGGASVPVYVVDTGVARGHAEFSTRVSTSYFDAMGGNGEDCNGHGTHVSGTIAGSTYGVAKSATVIPVRVLDCSGSGSMSSVIAGIDWAVANHTSGPAVLNMSLGGGAYSTLDAAVDRAVADGITVVVAAGNAGSDACTTSPARAQSALTVGATSNTDARASFSNWGTCLDIFAPGVSVTSAFIGSSTTTATLSGTSMASPHVAGAAARYLSRNTAATPAQVAAALDTAATQSVVGNPGTGSPNKLLYAPAEGYPSGTTPPPAPALPSAPGRPTLVPGNARITAAWSAANGNGLPVTGYTATLYRSSNNAVAATATVGGSTLTAEFTGLANGTSYYAKVVATTSAGTSPASAASAAATPFGTPSAPTAPTVTPGRGQLQVTWREPSGNGSPVLWYDLSVAPATGGEARVFTGLRSTKVLVLVSSGRWVMRVRATNAAGASAWSAPSAPSAPLGVRSATGPLRLISR